VTQVLHGLTLEVVRGGATVAGDSGLGFAQVPTVEPGDTLVLTDTTTSVIRTTTFSGLPALTAPSCGDAVFSGARADGASVSVSAPGLPALSISGAGTAVAGTFAAPLAAGAVVKATMSRAIDATFTVFDAVSATVGACPEPLAPAPAAPDPSPTPTPTPASAPSPAPVAAPAAPPADTLAPAGRTTLRARSSLALYRALRAGTFASSVSVSEPAAIRQTLLAGGTTLATASRSATRAGTFSLKLRLSAAGRRRLASAPTARLTLKTTLRDAAGNVRALPSRTLVARR
jgi:hypothetical protein